MLADELEEAWRKRRGSTPIDFVMRFSDQGLTLGAGTVLAASRRSGRDIQINPREPRLAVLLSAAHQRRPPTGSIVHLYKAAARWSEGQDALAAMHLSLSRLERLNQPEADARRLFIADRLLDSGLQGDAITAAVEANAADFEGMSKYDPEQPRVPAGNGRASGEWTTTGSGNGSGGVRLQPPGLDGGVVGARTASTMPQHRLTFTTFDGGPNDPVGWSGAFELEQPTDLGGVVIQKVETVIQQSGAPPKSSTYWEALTYIPPGATSDGRLVNDSWTPPVDGSHGSETTTATATFYEGLTMSTLPIVFRDKLSHEAGEAPATFHNPKSLLPIPSSPPLIRRGTIRY